MREATAVAALLLVLGGLAGAAGPSPPPKIGAEDRIRLAEAFAVIDDVQDRVWPGWSGAPSSLVLVDKDFEYLLRSGAKPEGFVASEDDPRLGAVLVRKRTFSPEFLATFPAFGPTPTIVVGTAEGTGKRSTTWVLAVAHEHFHQLQYSDPGYWSESEALALAGDDRTGMWMLNYPFPYEATSAAFAALSRDLARLVGGKTPVPAPEREAFWQKYAELDRGLKPADYRYLSFQLWQEGIARYAELGVAEAAAKEHRVSAEFARLRDHRTWAVAAAALRRETLDELQEQTMAADGRVVFYAFGAGLGFLLDQEGVAWRERYLREKFYLERYRAAVTDRSRERPSAPGGGDQASWRATGGRSTTSAETVRCMRSRSARSRR